MLINLIILAGLVFLISCLFIPLNIKMSHKTGLISIPNHRNIHEKPHPCSGGISFAVPVILAELFVILTSHDLIVQQNLTSLIIGSTLILITGIVDDKYNLKARYKLIMQVVIAVLMFFLGFRIEQITNPFGTSVPTSIMAFPFTIFWYLIIMNAMNLIDGLDGLATGISFICSMVLMFAGFYYHNPTVLISSMFLASGCLSFLFYNYPPSKIFMGDSGSLFLGFQFASISILGTYQLKGLTTMTLLIPVTVLFVPLLDTVTSVFRRIKNKQNIFHADKQHIHHRMLKMGFSEKMVMLISWFVTLLFAILALGYIFVNRHIMLVLLLILSIVSGALFYYLVKKEFFK